MGTMYNTWNSLLVAILLTLTTTADSVSFNHKHIRWKKLACEIPGEPSRTTSHTLRTQGSASTEVVRNHTTDTMGVYNHVWEGVTWGFNKHSPNPETAKFMCSAHSEVQQDTNNRS